MKLPVMEQFYTIQGEGKYTGHAAYFIRLAGCDVGCVWCDVKESWDAEGYPTFSTEDLATTAAKHPCDIVVITGGEPCMYDLTALTTAIRNAGKRVHIETSGAHPIRGNFDWITYSPKKFKAPIPESALLADELKVIVFNQSDFEWAKTHQKEVSEDCLLYLQPEWSKQELMHPKIVDFVLAHPEWQIGLQTHKFLGVD
ncbi:MAG: 7-carboxy-7-deazaguanine synthase [Bacteroidia bacterium]|jgi:7-carboxy-7-deazaguanine synthase